MAEYKGFCVYRRSYLLWSPVIFDNSLGASKVHVRLIKIQHGRILVHQKTPLGTYPPFREGCEMLATTLGYYIIYMATEKEGARTTSEQNRRSRLKYVRLRNIRAEKVEIHFLGSESLLLVFGFSLGGGGGGGL